MRGGGGGGGWARSKGSVNRVGDRDARGNVYECEIPSPARVARRGSRGGRRGRGRLAGVQLIVCSFVHRLARATKRGSSEGGKKGESGIKM